MFDTSLIKTQKKWPGFIRSSPIMKQKTIRKSFSKIGLNDGSAPTDLTANLFSIVRKKNKTKKKKAKAKAKNNNIRLRVVFSTNPWDIATMSMRGISSCQRWSSGAYKNQLIGSMVDPYAGIIYLTDGKRTNKGTRMFARAVVRLVSSKYDAKPSIYIERIYVNHNLRYSYDFGTHARTEFETFIRNCIPTTVPITVVASNNTIPNSPAVKKLKTKYVSYRDSGMRYGINGKMFAKRLDKIEKALHDA